MEVVPVIELETSLGRIGFEIVNANVCPSKWLLEAVVHEQIEAFFFDYVVRGSLLCGKIQWSGAHTVCAGGDGTADVSGVDWKHVGAGVLTCGIGECGLNIEDVCVTLSPQPLLDGKCVVVGRVYHGMEIIRKIAEYQVDADDKLFASIKSSSITLAWKVKESLDSDPNVVPAARQCQLSLLDEVL